MNKIKEKLASLFIPKNSPYCHHRFKKIYDPDGFCYFYGAKPCRYWEKRYNEKYQCEMEYCKLLKQFLSIQDQVKDCGINEDSL